MANKKIIILLIVFISIIYLLQNNLNAYYLRIINIIGINIILAITLNLTNGYLGVFSLGHAAFMAIGAYTCSILALPVAKKSVMLSALPNWLLSTQTPFMISLLIGGFVAMFFAFIIGIIVLRLKWHYLALSTLGFMIIVEGILINARNWTKGARGINNIPQYTSTITIYIAVIIIFYFCYKLINSHFGRAMKAIREDEIAAQMFGINPFYYKVLAFSIGAFGAGFAGGLWAHLITAINPKYFSYEMTFNIVTMVVIGGSGSLTGSIVGAIIITIFPELLRFTERGITFIDTHIPPLYGISQVILSIIMIFILIYRPGGLLGYQEISLSNLNMALKGKRKKTKRINVKM